VVAVVVAGVALAKERAVTSKLVPPNTCLCPSLQL
jgi:hypothetical protein